MQTLTITLFALAALGGLVLAFRHFKRAPLPSLVAVAHGVLAATGLVFLILYFLRTDGGWTFGLPLLLLVVAALGGFLLVAFHLRGQRPPSAAVVVHAVVAVIGFLTLLLAVL